MGKFYCCSFHTTATSRFVILAKANLFCWTEEQPPDNRHGFTKSNTILSNAQAMLYFISLFQQSPFQILSRAESQAWRNRWKQVGRQNNLSIINILIYRAESTREICAPSLFSRKICFSNTNTNNSVKRGPDKAMNAKGSSSFICLRKSYSYRP